jgi:hypothetical protein
MDFSLHSHNSYEAPGDQGKRLNTHQYV